MQSPRHRQLIVQLETEIEPTWADLALLSRLRRLRDGGPTEGLLVEVEDAWAGPGDQISIVYRPPWSTTNVGCVRRRSDDVTIVYGAEHAGEPTPEEFGWNVADFDLGEPLGNYAQSLTYDVQGLGWWSDIAPGRK